MKTTTTALCVALLSLVFAQDACALTGSSEILWRQFILTIEKADSVGVYIGTPRVKEKSAAAPAPTVDIDDFEFLRDPVELTPDLAAQLILLVTNPHSFSDYRGTKFCGGFHPDMCIEWRFEENGQHWRKRAFVCLGCKECRFIDSMSAIQVNMSPAAADQFAGLLRGLRKE